MYAYATAQLAKSAPNVQFQTGRGLSSGEYFLWAAHEDMFAPEYVERCVAFLEENPDVVLCYSKSIEIDEQGQSLRRKEQIRAADYLTLFSVSGN